MEMIKVTVIACFSIGLGAALTPLGEPLSTITFEKLAGPPYYAGFGYLVGTIGYLVLPGILVLGILGMVMMSRAGTEIVSPQCQQYRETLREVVIRYLNCDTAMSIMQCFIEGARRGTGYARNQVCMAVVRTMDI